MPKSLYALELKDGEKLLPNDPRWWRILYECFMSDEKLRNEVEVAFIAALQRKGVEGDSESMN